MGRMRSAYRVTEKCRRSATMPMWRWYFYNRSSAVFLHATSFYNRSSAVVANGLVSRGRRTNPVLTYETALRRFPLCATSLYNRTSVVFAMYRTLAHTDGWRFFQWGMSMVGRRFLCRIILVGIVLKLWLSVIFPMIYLSIKCFYEKMSEKLVFCC